MLALQFLTELAISVQTNLPRNWVRTFGIQQRICDYPKSSTSDAFKALCCMQTEYHIKELGLKSALQLLGFINIIIILSRIDPGGHKIFSYRPTATPCLKVAVELEDDQSLKQPWV